MNVVTEQPDQDVVAALPAIPAWERFVAARTSDVFCDAWLTLICEKFPSVRKAAVLIEASDGQNYVPIAVWPAVDADMARMGPAVSQALSDRRIAVLPVADAPGVLHAAIPVMSGERIAGAAVFELPTDPIVLSALLREVHWASAWLTNLLGKRELDDAVEASQRASGIVHTLATALRHVRFQQAMFDLVNELRRRFDCTRVAIGLVRDAQVRLAALSEAATFEKSSPLVQAYRDAMAEATDLAQAVEASDGRDGRPASGYRAHTELLQRTGAHVVLSVPIVQHARTIAVVTFEREGQPLDETERRWIDAFAALVAPVVEQRMLAERTSFGRMRDEAVRFWRNLVGPRFLVWKAVGLLVLLVAVALVCIPVDYRVSAKTVTEGEIQRVAAAPFEGFLAEGFVRAGDTVRKGQQVARLDDHELRVERIRWASERDQYDNKLREAMAGHDLTAIGVTSAQLSEAQAQLDLLDDKLDRATVRAPYDGVVVSGDLSHDIGTPVEAGKKLFEIAPLDSYRIILEVDERDIAPIRDGQHGELVMNGFAGHAMTIDVLRVMPVATAEDGKNFYRVEARLTKPSNLLLPGMEGVAKVDVGRRQLGWVLLHGALDWLRLQLWTWGL
ncbi:GAF domain-containing protein [Luteibacter rhizovicinus]|uniref:GAF domain-containing protein n=1 Tax=Luteibacter rhizovicinus TaxID=242606 RepID=A0A4R3YM39_9GAMM|nr:HlyD family efflux transporter periplasmic adaptor subunit [Luteibacter rhizovicinus]TCV93350.1 GAF domain-containing protein [Luteibacter rhizovicinus]